MSDPDFAKFPSEDGWLDLEPAEIRAEFVERTMARLVDAGLVLGDSVPDEEEEARLRELSVPADLLAQFAPPEVSERFLDQTLQTVQRDRASQWRELLLRYEAPEPTSDFVDRTLLALGETTEPGPKSARLLRGLFTRRAAAVAAAAALVLFLLWPERQSFALRSVIAGSPPTVAYAHSPAVLSHLLAEPNEHASADPAFLWLAAGGNE